MPRPPRKAAFHARSGGIEPYNVAQKQYVCVMALYTKMTWRTISSILGEVFDEVYNQALVHNVFCQMKQRSSQVFVFMEKATKDNEDVKEILEGCEKARLAILQERKLLLPMIQGMKHRLQGAEGEGKWILERTVGPDITSSAKAKAEMVKQ